MHKNIRDRVLWGINIILGVCVIVLCIIKFQLKDETIVEANYIGDVESENRKKVQDQEGQELGEPKKVIEGDMTDKSQIRVLIETTGFKSIYHDKVSVSADGGLQLIYQVDKEECKHIIQGDERLELDSDSPYVQDSSVRIKPCKEGECITIHNIKRGYGAPVYENILEVYKDEKGMAIINEVQIDQYLRGVLPSEMPSGYEVEALKAQAVAARSYAYKHLKEYAYPEYKAHVNDSTDFQVFNNTKQSERANEAIESTANAKVVVGNEIANTYFFSTSCGHTTDMGAWGSKITEQTSHLQGKSISKELKSGEKKYYEEDIPWFKWSVTVSKKQLQEILEKNLGKKIGEVKDIEVVEEGTGGVVTALKVEGSSKNITIKTEYDIREALGSTSYDIIRQDGSKVEGRALLPSAFFTIQMKDKVVINGGGFGHGIGMSQAGANEMAKDGMGYKEILQAFYTGIEITK